jgi:Cu(I)/Ag(I) efflux system membrane fusion protein
VKSGLEEGELVVTHGTFKIDSELQIQAKPSMMSPEGGGSVIGHQHDQAGESSTSHQEKAQRFSESADAVGALTPVYKAYFDVQMALALDDPETTTKAANAVRAKVGKVDMSLFSRRGHGRWMELSKQISEYASGMASSENIDAARKDFYHLAKAIIDLQNSFGHVDDRNYYLTFCPMANDYKGAYWLQTVDTVYNSFYGAKMLRCGVIKKPLASEIVEGNK